MAKASSRADCRCVVNSTLLSGRICGKSLVDLVRRGGVELPNDSGLAYPRDAATRVSGPDPSPIGVDEVVRASRCHARRAR